MVWGTWGHSPGGTGDDGTEGRWDRGTEGRWPPRLFSRKCPVPSGGLRVYPEQAGLCVSQAGSQCRALTCELKSRPAPGWLPAESVGVTRGEAPFAEEPHAFSVVPVETPPADAWPLLQGHGRGRRRQLTPDSLSCDRRSMLAPWKPVEFYCKWLTAVPPMSAMKI